MFASGDQPYQPQLGHYDYVQHLARSQLAWEYLRRNLDYRRDWFVSAPGRCRSIRLTDGTILLRVRRRSLRAEEWGLCIFSDPNKTALEAYVFWLPQDYPRVASAYVRPCEDPGFGSVVSLREIRCRKVLLKAVDGEQHILLCGRRRIAQVRCVGEDIRLGPFGLELVVDHFPDVESRQQDLRRLADFFRNPKVAASKSEWTVEARRHRDALAAIDRRADGCSYREIAKFLYGEQAVQDEWTNPDQTMKNRVIRRVKRGIRLMSGGYRALLA